MRDLLPLNKHYILGSGISKETGLETKPDTLQTLRLDHCSSVLTEAVGEGCGGLEQVRDLLKVWLMVLRHTPHCYCHVCFLRQVSNHEVVFKDLFRRSKSFISKVGAVSEEALV
jgi:hypothetical protein